MIRVEIHFIENDFKRRPVWAQIDLDAAGYNMRNIRKMTGPDILIAAVVKANAYGHGAVEVAKTFLREGADRLAVACLDEAVELRHAGITSRIIILGHTDGRRAEELITYGVDAAVFRYVDAKQFSDEAVRQGRIVNLHIAVDTGMGRIGYRPCEDSVEEIQKISMLSNVVLDGLFTHFAVSDMAGREDTDFTKKQYEQFSWFRKRLAEQKVPIHYFHCCNSAGVVEFPDLRSDMVRPGIIQYGYDPSHEVRCRDFIPRPVMSLRCCVTYVKIIHAGDTVSYGRHFKAEKTTKIATLPLGYSDGYPRLLSNRAEVLIHGRRARQVGNICMDQCMIDVTDIPDVQSGDEVVLFGSQDGVSLPLEELADLIGTIDHEIICNINRRVPRVYVKGGKIVRSLEYLFD